MRRPAERTPCSHLQVVPETAGGVTRGGTLRRRRLHGRRGSAFHAEHALPAVQQASHRRRYSRLRDLGIDTPVTPEARSPRASRRGVRLWRPMTRPAGWADAWVFVEWLVALKQGAVPARRVRDGVVDRLLGAALPGVYAACGQVEAFDAELGRVPGGSTRAAGHVRRMFDRRAASCWRRLGGSRLPWSCRAW